MTDALGGLIEKVDRELLCASAHDDDVATVSTDLLRAIATELRRVRDAMCGWTLDDNADSAVWQSSCGQTFCFTEDGPVENTFNFCHGCGSSIRIVPVGGEG